MAKAPKHVSAVRERPIRATDRLDVKIRVRRDQTDRVRVEGLDHEDVSDERA